MAKEIVANTGAMYNALTNGSKIVGKIIADSDFRIDGEVEGEIVCNHWCGQWRHCSFRHLDTQKYRQYKRRCEN